MAEKAAQADRFSWLLPLYAAAGALAALLPLVFSGEDIGEILYLIVVGPAVSLILIIFAIRRKGRQRLSILSMLVVYWAVSWPLFVHSFEVRSAGRWLLWSKTYRAEVLAQPDSGHGELKHIEWDGWGFPGAGDTVVYLVFDPNDSLVTQARNQSAGKVTGIPCGVSRVRRLESRWYTVIFYTETDWTHCN